MNKGYLFFGKVKIMDFVSLSELLHILCRGNCLHICVWDLSGILRQGSLKLDFSDQMHGLPFCDAAKATRKGYNLCLRCKGLANHKAIKERQPFFGYCSCGLYEAVYPVVVDDGVRCIVYVGNLVVDKERTLRRLHRTCQSTGASENVMRRCLQSSEYGISKEEAMQVAKLVASYIELLCRERLPASSGTTYHWVVEMLMEYLRKHYAYPVTLRDLASVYYLNEKYVGRLFKNQTGRTFHEFLNDIRMEHAQRLLRETSKSITEIALDCGFDSAGYFCRIFKKREGVSPSVYRRDEQTDFAANRT